MTQTSSTPLRVRQLATQLAALRFWQAQLEKDPRFADGHVIASEDGSFPPLSAVEIDELCDDLNRDPTGAIVEPPPAEVGQPPRYRPGQAPGAYLKAERLWIEVVQQWARTHGSSNCAGALFRVPHADSYALYVVRSLEPLRLIHLPLGDAYAMPEPTRRGLTAADVARSCEAYRLLTRKTASGGAGA